MKDREEKFDEGIYYLYLHALEYIKPYENERPYFYRRGGKAHLTFLCAAAVLNERECALVRRWESIDKHTVAVLVQKIMERYHKTGS